MSILCCHTPHFLFNLAAQRKPKWAALPIGLMGPDERVWAASQSARHSGVSIGLTAHQARMRCADVQIHELDLAASEDAQTAFTGLLAQTGLNVEVQGYGSAYVDLTPVTTSPHDALPVCGELGKQIRKLLGAKLQPALGCDTSKFTSRAASAITQPGCMKLVNHAEETRFLSPQPITLLPLPFESLQMLHWLGLKTLGDFTRLPIADVQQRFGKAGKLAHEWARGLDHRPVRATTKAAPETIQVNLDAPTTSHDEALSAAMRSLRPALRAIRSRLEGCRRLRVELVFLGGEVQTATHSFAQPMSDAAQVQSGLSRALRTYAWPGELMALTVMLLEVAELCPQQLSLFAEFALSDKPDLAAQPFMQLVEELGILFGSAFFRGQITDPTHPIRERRFCLSPISVA
jgi:nucleotidyltransferase/DNA polymerase involved in DNA repair